MQPRQGAQQLKDDGMWERARSNKAWVENRELEEEKESCFLQPLQCVRVRAGLYQEGERKKKVH